MSTVTCLADAEVGDEVWSTTHRLLRADLVAYANASGDQNPIHQDEEFARSVGLPDVIAHGMLTMGLVASAVETAAAGREVASFTTRFAAPVVVPAGDDGVEVALVLTIAATDESAGTVTLDAAVSVAGTKVLNRARAVVNI